MIFQSSKGELLTSEYDLPEPPVDEDSRSGQDGAKPNQPSSSGQRPQFKVQIELHSYIQSLVSLQVHILLFPYQRRLLSICKEINNTHFTKVNNLILLVAWRHITILIYCHWLLGVLQILGFLSNCVFLLIPQPYINVHGQLVMQKVSQTTPTPDPEIPLNQLEPRGNESEDDIDYVTYVV